MISYSEARNLMPSVQRAKALKNKKLSEMEELIQRAAQEDFDSIKVYVRSDEFPDFVLGALKFNGFEVKEILDSTQYGSDCTRTLYEISWRAR